MGEACRACTSSIKLQEKDHIIAPEASETQSNSPFSSDPASQALGYCLSSPNLHHPCFLWKSYGH